MNPVSALRQTLDSHSSLLGLALIAATFCPAAGFAAGAAKIQIVSGPSQQTTYGADFPSPLVIRVSDSISKHDLARVAVRFFPGKGIKLNATQVTTDRFGLAIVAANGVAVGDSSVDVEIANAPETRVTLAGLAVHKAVLTVVPADLAATVGTVPAITQFRFNGFVNGESAQSAHISGTPILTTAATKRSPDANYAIKGGPGTLSSPNYDFVAGFGTLVLVGTGKSGDSEAENSTLYDADGLPSTLPSASVAANAVRKAFLDQSIVPAPLMAAGSTDTGSPTQVQAASELRFSAADAEASTLAGEVKAIQTLNRRDTSENSNRAARNAVQKAVSLPVAGISYATSGVGVRAATELSLQASPTAMRTSYSVPAIRSAFPPQSR